MDLVHAPLAPGVHALAVWDTNWNSYNNCYVVAGPAGVVLVDTGRAEHLPALVEGLRQAGVALADVTTLVATHRHADHIGNAAAVPGAIRALHPADRRFLKKDLRPLFAADLPDRGSFAGLEAVHLGHHTEGSVALYDPGSGVLFAGDHWCFFQDALPPEGLVTAGDALRQQSLATIRAVAASPQEREKYRLDLFLEGVRRLLQFPAEFLATGHGPVLRGRVQEFLADMLAAAGDP